MNHPIRKYSVTWTETIPKGMEWFPCRDPDALVKYLEDHPFKKGVEVILAYSAEDAITQFKLRNRNLIVTDIAPFEEPFFMEEAPGVAIGNVKSVLEEHFR